MGRGAELRLLLLEMTTIRLQPRSFKKRGLKSVNQCRPGRGNRDRDRKGQTQSAPEMALARIGPSLRDYVGRELILDM